MVTAPVLLLFALLGVTVGFTPASLGDQLHYSYNSFDTLPLTSAEAKQNGWTVKTTCDAHYGFAATKEYGGASPTHPVTLFFNGAG